MKPSIKKAVSGKTMRVAATFTGAAACAVAFTPAATAATGAAGHQPHTFRINPHHIRPDNIINGNCRGANQSHWLHWRTPIGDTCWGFRGIQFFSPAVRVVSFCGGNNIGNMYGFNSIGPVAISYQQGTTYAHVKQGTFFDSGVSISNFSGTQKCGL